MIKMENKEQLRKVLYNNLDMLFEKLENQNKKLEELRDEIVFKAKNIN